MTIAGDEIRNPRLTRKWGRYYKIDEVDRHLFRVENQIEGERNALSALRTLNETLGRESGERAEKIALQEQTISEQFREIGELGNQLTQCLGENAQLSEQIERQRGELTRLQKHIEVLDGQIAVLERQDADAIIEEAVRKAERIVNKAVADRDKMVMKIAEQRGRLIAACRAAYYNALQFKQDLAERFRGMEQELDASIDVLQALDNSRLALDYASVQGLDRIEHDGVLP